MSAETASLTAAVLSAAIGTAAGMPESPLVSCCLASLSLSSRQMRWAIFLPTPGARVSSLASPVMIDRASWLVGAVLRIASAALGPTPDTLISI